MASLKKLSSIQSLTELYQTGKVRAYIGADLPTAVRSINDKICTIQYDITKLEVGAIVNAANRRLLGGGGVDGAIHRAAGPKLYRECKTLGGCDTGSAKITDAYDLPCQKVVHAVGPVYYTREESEPLLRSCYRTALHLAVQHECKSIAFSAISTGIYGYPSDEAAWAALNEVRQFLEQSSEGDKIEKVIFCNFLQKDVDVYNHLLPRVFPPVQEDQTDTGSVNGNTQEETRTFAKNSTGTAFAGSASAASNSAATQAIHTSDTSDASIKPVHMLDEVNKTSQTTTHGATRDTTKDHSVIQHSMTEILENLEQDPSAIIDPGNNEKVRRCAILSSGNDPSVVVHDEARLGVRNLSTKVGNQKLQLKETGSSGTQEADTSSNQEPLVRARDGNKISVRQLGHEFDKLVP